MDEQHSFLANKLKFGKIIATHLPFRCHILMRILTVILCFCALLSFGSGNTQTTRLTIEQKLHAFQLDRHDIEIYIDKTEHTLTLKVGQTTLKQYKCVFGGNPRDDKKYEGDKCTPEGVFHIQAKYPHPDWNKFMLIDYPTKQSWQKFQANKAHGKLPPNASIGGAIGIHGVPVNKNYLIEKGINWTLGCISLSNADVDEIYRYVDIGTKVTIAK
jgi:murein L,D-transpeptidase YafK